MSNSIDLNLESNNSMKSLSFFWIAIFKDGTKIEQFQNNQEQLYKRIQEKKDELVYFNLTDRKGHLFTVDVVRGAIAFNDLTLSYREDIEKKENVRLIFFRRHQVDTTERGTIVAHRMWYHLGYQYNDNNGNNRKVILKIDSDGNFLIES